MRKIAIFTGTRAEYGLLYWTLKGLKAHPRCDLQLFVGGMHLSREFGYTIEQIKQDGFDVTGQLEFLVSSDTALGVSKSMALAMMSAAEQFVIHTPDMLLVLGDRYESLAVAQAAMLANIPIAHIHGGEATEGLIDEAIRHSLSKMSHLHFTTTEVYKKRVEQLGEQPNRVFNVGAPGIDNLLKLNLLSKKSLEKELDFKLGEQFFLVTYHPLTLDKESSLQALENLLLAFGAFPHYQLVITYPNADTFGRVLIDKLQEFAKSQTTRVLLTQSLGQLKYLSLMKVCDAVVGNSSSGILEAPSCKVATVNIGARQLGRVAAKSVIQSGGSVEEIVQALKTAISLEHKEVCMSVISPYGTGGASDKIVHEVMNQSLEDILLKRFNDFGGES
ncbi:UDP-N-acetyl-D-glucosamine 2-epimerase, UDP-hydrolysing [Pseudoalteromonas sp. MSK9-3]|uniref:UDP-N-acetylglucosamine 2-epimerase n=1 Tax=Pseudoalteromonas sp. MSK9-3 TaxID=1897633 RepID=UPI000E6B6A29|nr:UDP-N-acetylglucosamine 2-epimerase [Pseudoalteromonas sp. MSK9-3]RJE77342.1 UDP-N-acetyl-D-glucosamine 2-epimerase, UDP-hydrolysing [Pseudoalteromonas sp. MSK9-3]